MVGLFIKIGNFFRSVQGWLFMLSLVPAALVNFTGWWEKLSWTQCITYTTVALAAGLAIVALGLVIWDRATSHFTRRQEQRRVAEDLKDYTDSGFAEIDTHTAGALWAGTNDPGSLQFKLRFRRIKMAIMNGEIVGATRLNEGGKPNIRTNIPTAALRDYFLKRGIIAQKDWG